MPEPTPTTDTGKGKKLSRNQIILIGGGAIILFLIYRAKKKKEEENGPPPGTNPYTAQSFIPVTGENVAGVGAQSSGGSFGAGVPQNSETDNALLQAQQKNFETITNYLIESQRVKNEAPQPTPVAPTGGGAPSSGQIASGSGSGGGGSGATTTKKPAPPAPTFKNITCGNGCPGHKYTTHTECAVKKGGKCVWP